MFYYLWASYTTDDLTPGAIVEGLDSFASGYSTAVPQRAACNPATPSRLANVIQRMVAKSSRDRFLSMIQVRKELTVIRDQEQEAMKKESEVKGLSRVGSDIKAGTSLPTMKSVPALSTLSSSQTSSTLTRPVSPANSTHSFKSTSTRASQELDASSLASRRSGSISQQSSAALSHEDRAFVLESVLSLAHITNLQELLRAVSYALDNILVGHPPEEMAIILWQKDEHSPNGGTWAIIEDKYQPGSTQSTLAWTDLSERRDHMPVLVRKALDTQEPVFSTVVGSRSQLPTIACVPIMTSPTNPSTLVGAIYLHHLHPRFYFTKRDKDMLMLFCQKLASPLLHCDKIGGLEKQLLLATQRNRFLEDTIAKIQKNEYEVFSWMEALPCFVWAAERDDVVSRRYLSRSWFDFTGLPGDTRTGDRWISAMHPDDVASFQKEVSQSYKTGVHKDCEFRLMRYDGVYRWHLSRAVPVLNHSGAILKWVGVTIDIDDLYRAQKAELHKKSNFLANMSHELRTPFSGFHGMLSLLGYSNLDEEQQECVYTAKASCEKLLLIIDDLLDYSKLEVHKVTLEASPFDLQDVFDEVEDIVQPLATQKSLELAFLKTDNVPEVLVGDANRLKQILLNLVGNAIKFTHSGRVHVKCRVLDRDSDMSSTAEWIDDDKFYFKHEKNGGGLCQSEDRPPNSGRFSSPEPLSENSITLEFEVQDTGIGISPEEQQVLFSPFSQVDGSATRSYGGSGLGLSICKQLVTLMKGRIGLHSEREQGSTFFFLIQCEHSTLAENPVKSPQEAEVGDSTKEIKRITRTLGTPRILIASTSEITIGTLQTYLSDFNTEVANTPSTAASRLEESVTNGIRFDFVCWDFPTYDPNHAMMLELQAKPNMNNVHFVLLYTPNEVIRRAQSLQLPSSTSQAGALASGRKKPTLSQSSSLRMENGRSNFGGNHASAPVPGGEVPGLSCEMVNSLRITCISKPIRRLKLLRAFVEILDDSARIHGATTVKKGSVTSAVMPSGPMASATITMGSLTGSTISESSSTTLSPISTTRNPSTSKMASLEGALGKDVPVNTLFKDNPGSSSNSGNSTVVKPDLSSVGAGAQPKAISQSLVGADLVLHDVPVKTIETSLNKTLETVELEEVTVIERDMTPEPTPAQRGLPVSVSPKADTESGAVNSVQDQIVTRIEKEKEKEKDKDKDQAKEKEKELTAVKASFKQKLPITSSGRSGKLRSNSPKPAKTSKLVTEEATEVSLSIEEADRIVGMRILLAEDNLVAQKVLSKQLSLFGLVISCANDGADALTLFKSHPRGYYTLGFFDHHMPNCDGVQATQQIRALEKEHAAEIKGPVPRLPVVAVSADIQETARRACLDSGMERYVTKPLMQKDLVAMVRQYCVIGDAEASTLPYIPPPEGAEVSADLGSAGSIVVSSTVEAMVSAGHVSAPIGANSAISPSMLLSVTSPPTAAGDKTPVQKPGALKRELELSPAALRGLALIRENSLQDESSKVGGGGSIKTMNLTLPTVSPSSAAVAGVSGTAALPGSHPMQHSNSHLGLSHGAYSSSSLMMSGSHPSISKPPSCSSLSSSYHAGFVSSPIVVTSSMTSAPTVTSLPVSTLAAAATPSTSMGPTAMGPPSSTLSASSHLPGPIKAMAAGAAAAAVAVASAAVNTVSSAIQDHIHTPSIYAARGSSISNSSNLCSPWTTLLNGSNNTSINSVSDGNVVNANGTTIGPQTLLQIQQQQQLQQHQQQLQQQFQQNQFAQHLAAQQQQQLLQEQAAIVASAQVTAAQQAAIQAAQAQAIQGPTVQQGQALSVSQPEHIYHPPQELFVPYLHPYDPSLAVEQEFDPVSSKTLSTTNDSINGVAAPTCATAPALSMASAKAAAAASAATMNSGPQLSSWL
ncbi:histidine kinase osmosensor [Dissophora ornata]|nr:histidine kinase osmosensor [Dissophora ornata]